LILPRDVLGDVTRVAVEGVPQASLIIVDQFKSAHLGRRTDIARVGPSVMDSWPPATTISESPLSNADEG
jgi:hypothetical protein